MSFPDLAEPISITEVGVKVVNFLSVGLGVVVAIMLGLVLIKKLLAWIGRGVDDRSDAADAEAFRDAAEEYELRRRGRT